MLDEGLDSAGLGPVGRQHHEGVGADLLGEAGELTENALFAVVMAGEFLP